MENSPAVWKWYKVYCAVFVLFYVMLGLGMFFFRDVFLGEMMKAHPEQAAEKFYNVYVALIWFFAIPFAISFFLPKSPGAWVYHLVLICLGFTSICCLPTNIPLLIYWIKPETKAFFGRTTT